MADYDLVVIGSGPAGEKGAAQAAYFGKKVALIERESELGGACVNTGTLPSKTLRESALYLSGHRQRGLHGVSVALEREASVHDLLHREEFVVSQEHQRIAQNLERHRVTLVQGEASFVDPHTLSVRRPGWPEQRLTADFVLIATGSRPHRPEMYPFIHTHVFDSDEIVRIDFIPRSMSVVGAGVIGCEYACLFATLGVKVTLIESRGVLLPFLDGQMSSLLAERIRALGIDLKMNETVERLTVLPRSVLMGLKSAESDFETDIVLVAAGRNSNTDMLKLEAAGIVAGKRGQLDVDAHYCTKVPHIYAAGDVIGFPALASTSMEQARVAVTAMFDLKYKTALAPILPYGIFTIPELSCAGETEETLKAAKVPYVVGLASFKDNARGKIIGEDGALKLIFRKGDMKLLGVHIIGEGATELVHIGLTAMLQDATADLFIRMCFNYPTLSESYKYATYDALGEGGAVMSSTGGGGVFPVIMAGGSGTRFWPLSRKKRPKQFLPLTSSRALIVETAARLTGLAGLKDTFVVCGKVHAGPTHRLLKGLPLKNVLVEPEARNTAPAIALATLHVARRQPDGVLVVLPSDQHVQDVPGFRRVVDEAVRVAREGRIVTLGITPSRPDTGYGYIRLGPVLSGQAREVAAFVEKPNLPTAQGYLASGDFVWNAGIFIFRADVMLAALKTHLPAMTEPLEAIGQALGTRREAAVLKKQWAAMPAVSIDYGVAEKHQGIAVVPGEFGWSDVGSFNALPEVRPLDARGNVVSGEHAMAIDCDGCVVLGGQRPLSVVGMKDTVVVDAGDAVLVVPKDKCQDVRKAVEALKAHKLDRYL